MKHWNHLTNVSGPEKVTNRVDPCNCGCKGSDSWHAAHFKRVIRKVREFNDVREVRTKAYGTASCIAEGFIQLPRGETRVVFVVYHAEGWGWARLGWVIAEKE